LYTKPLLDLVRKDVAWRWTEVEERSLRGGIEALIHSHLKGFTKLLYDLPKSLLVCYSDWSKLTNSLNIVLRVKDLRSRAVEPAFFSSKKLPDSYQNKSSTLSLEEEENFAPITEELSPDMDEEYDGIDHLEEMVNALTKQVDKAKKKRDWALNNVDSKTKLPRPKQRVNALKAEGLWLLASQQIDMLDRDSCSTGIVAYLDMGRL
jgi:hypothetical protein